MPDVFAIRPAGPDDHPFVIDCFWRDFRQSVYAEGLSVPTIRGLIVDLLGRPDWHTVIAEMPDVPGEIYGWMTYRSAREVAWLSVKARYRRNGCAKALLDHAGVHPGRVACAFLDPRIDNLARPRGYRLLFRPFVTSEAGQVAKEAA